MVGINTEGGAAIGGDAKAGGDVTGRDVSDYSHRTEQRMVDQRRDDRRYDNQQGGIVNFQSQDNAVIWREIVGLGNQLSEMQERLSSRISAVDFKLDDLPNRVRLLEVKVDPIPIPVPLPISFPTWLALSMIVVMLVVAAFFAGRIL